MRHAKAILAATVVWLGSLVVWPSWVASAGAVVYGTERAGDRALDVKLARVLEEAGFTGEIESTLARRLGRPINPKLADLGRLLWFDTRHSLHQDNACAGCHSPTNGFGDSQGMAIGVQNKNLVGPDRGGPRNQRRSPLVINTAFLSALMWNGRFSSPSGDPFDNSLGFHFFAARSRPAISAELPDLPAFVTGSGTHPADGDGRSRWIQRRLPS
jgi:cytochrome c peroxidase